MTTSTPASSSVAASSSSASALLHSSATANAHSDPNALHASPSEASSAFPHAHSDDDLLHSRPHTYPAHHPPHRLVSAPSAHSPSSPREPPTSYYHPQHHQQFTHGHGPHNTQQHRPPSSYGYKQPYHYSSLPADSLPRTFSRAGPNDQSRPYHPPPPPSPSSFSQPPPLRQHYPLHQSTYPPMSVSSTHTGNRHSHLQDFEDAGTGGNSNNISTNLPEYSYPMTMSGHRQQRDHYRPFHLQHHRHLQHQQQMEHQQGYNQGLPLGFRSQEPYPASNEKRLHVEAQEQHSPLSQRVPPPPIRTQWDSDSMRDCPPLPYQGGSSQPFRGVEDRPSPATPRSAPLHNSLLRQPVLDPYQFTESPIDYRSPNDSLRHATMGASARKYGRQGHDVQYYSEWDDTRKRDTEDEDEDADNMAFEGSTKRQKLNLTAQRHPFRRNTTPPFRNMQGGTSRQIGDSAGKMQAEEDNGDNHGHSNLPSTTSSRKQSVSGSIHGDERSPSKPKKGKSSAQMRGLRRSSLDTPIEDAIDEIEDDAHVGAGTQSSLGLGKGLRIYAQRVCERVEARGSTSYNELVQELFGGPPSEQIEDAAEVQGQENIRRRAYDALNVLEALNVISMVNKDIRWVGIEQSSVVREVSRCQAVASLSQEQPPEDGEDEESEEPEDDDMEIEELQRKVDAMRLQTELEQAKLQDQVTRHVQLTNLVKRNKRSEAKAKEREERHKKREEEKRAKAAATEQDPTMTDVGPQGGSDLNEEATRKPERHRHRRSSRQPSERPQGQADEVNTSAMDEDQDEDSEEARRRRKQERRERRERKEKRAQRRQEREEEEERIQLPFVVVRMPGYTRASSDSESSISVVRRVREERMFKNSGKNRRHCESTGQETTMVEIQIPQQDDLSIISDTEILGDLGLNALTTDELEGMLPAGLTNVVQYTVNTERRTHNGDMSTSSNDEPLSITVRGGFEREIIRTVNEGASR